MNFADFLTLDGTWGIPQPRRKPARSGIDDPSVQIPAGSGIVRNNSTGAMYNLEGETGAGAGPELDYSRPPVEVFGLGKGHYLRGDPTSAMVDGRAVSMGRDTNSENKLNLQNIALSEKLQSMRNADVDIRLKEQRLTAKPKPPPNYRWTEDGNLERIPGGAADEKVVSAYNTDSLNLRSVTSSMDNMIGLANQILKSPGLDRNYGVSGVFPNWPGGEAADAKAMVQRLKDNAGFSALNELKAASSSGSSGLGAVTEFEHKLLQNQIANLDKAQSANQVRSEIANLIRATEASKQRMINQHRKLYGKMVDDSVQQPTAYSPSSNPISFDELPNAAQFEGQYITDTVTGQRLRAVNGSWVPLQ